MAEVAVRDVPENERYVVEVDGTEAGFTVYHIRSDDIYFFVHTEIHNRFSGTGLGKALVKGALDDVRSKAGSIVPICPFVWGFVQRNPEYNDLVNHEVFDKFVDKLHP